MAYWGQNSSGNDFPNNPEKELKDVCAKRKYDIIVIGFVVTFFGKNNKGTGKIMNDKKGKTNILVRSPCVSVTRTICGNLRDIRVHNKLLI